MGGGEMQDLLGASHEWRHAVVPTLSQAEAMANDTRAMDDMLLKRRRPMLTVLRRMPVCHNTLDGW